jgi:formamidopyrimidine-DNA glycosylase
MPELPEVETVCQHLKQHILSAKITEVELFRTGLRYPFPTELDAELAGRQIIAIERRAKYILCHFAHQQSLILHLGMSGRIRVVDTELARTTHEHVRLWLEDGRYVSFTDPRRFGILLLVPTLEWQKHALIQHLGIEPLDAAFDGAYLFALCQARKAPIKSLLMQQNLLVGVGNIYASESLFRACIQPLRPAKNMALEECVRLVETIKEVLEEAIAAGGSSLRDYRQADGSPGFFQQQLLVYGRQRQPCHVCQTIIEQCVIAGRSTFFCSQCQY